jgi:N-acetylglucosaminyl-diphospho-decaprenol L-rhamnosyltransferase
MVISVIIVNYRVRYFLELCLASVQKALMGFEAEVLVVDNNSGDGGIEALRSLFPSVRFIENGENVGFAKANNQALTEAVGEYVLFLNPDSVLPEDFVRVCLGFMEAGSAEQGVRGSGEARRPVAGGDDRPIGAVGVRMVDGSGRFLPESRRGFPSPWVAFCKLSGLSALFPRSRVFARYYLGHLPADRTSPAAVLSGACLLVRRAVLAEVGGFDERFFMYAEDIDLSYRIEKAGYVNYYLADTTMIHFKGESTQKDIRYIRQFYRAMSQFRRKHFNKGLPAVFNSGMEAVIRVRVRIGALVRGNRPGGPDFQGRSSGLPLSLLVTGDPQEVLRVQALLGLNAMTVVAGQAAQADGVVFCEGPEYTFQECITMLEEAAMREERLPVFFHASGTRSAVGSVDRDGRGETLVF